MTLRSLASSLVVMLLLGPIAAAGEGPPFPFVVSKPAGDGPFPAVVILHDCSGLGPRSSGMAWRWSSELTQRGYVTVWPDSFTSRGRPQGVCAGAAAPRITHEQRAGDAYAALAYLASLPLVDARRIAVMGGSHGGSSTIAAIVDAPENGKRTDAAFAAAIALYPACGRSYGAWTVQRRKEPWGPIAGYTGTFKPVAPLLILIGALDDWTPAEPCRKLAEAAQSAGYPVEIKVYPEAHHSFDSILPMRYVAERINANSPTGRGATTGGNAKAWSDAIDQVARFLDRHAK